MIIDNNLIAYEYYKNQNEWYSKVQQDLQGIDYTNIPENINKETAALIWALT